MSQIHNQGFPHDFAKVCSHNGPTNPTNKPQLKATRKRNSRSKELSNLRCLGRTVRMDQADCPRGPGGLSAGSLRTVRNSLPNLQYCTLKNGQSVLYPRTVHVERTARAHLTDCPPNLVQPKAHGQMDRTKGKQEHTEKLTNYRLKASSRTVCVVRRQ
jgi:hypothetical protein